MNNKEKMKCLLADKYFIFDRQFCILYRLGFVYFVDRFLQMNKGETE